MIDLCAYQQASAVKAATADMHAHLALHHLQSACQYSSKLAQIEQENAGKPFGAFWAEILHSSLGVAALTVLFLDDCADRLYIDDCVNPVAGHAATAADRQTEPVGMEDILRKYSNALEICVGKPLDYSVAPVQNVDALIKLRNKVVDQLLNQHRDELELYDKLSFILHDKFESSVFFPDEPVLPRAWASYSFAAWAIRSTVEFLEYFYAEAGVPSPIAGLKPQLAKLSGSEF
ncbi:MAG: hypothetical protein PHR30_15620 [Gallionellaceae bacterium]|nr:hypothetical protein [Gallionellaceae bacterium]